MILSSSPEYSSLYAGGIRSGYQPEMCGDASDIWNAISRVKMAVMARVTTGLRTLTNVPRRPTIWLVRPVRVTVTSAVPASSSMLKFCKELDSVSSNGAARAPSGGVARAEFALDPMAAATWLKIAW